MSNVNQKRSETNFGINLRKLRKNAGMTVEFLAEMLDVSTRIIYDWEDSRKTPKFERAVQIANLFNASLDGMLRE